jgi:23S rRNA pseudouridine2605 synthase
MIKAGRITCNGQVCSLGQSADPDIDEILVDGKPLPSAGEKVYIMLHKPRGYVTTLSDEKGRPDAASLVSCGQRVYPVGRLDMDSEGLLLFTNDGDFANRLMHPSHEVKKIYEVHVTGFTRDGLRVLQEPMELDGYRIRRPGVRILKEQESKAVLEVTIHEGRNRQVRRMCDHAGMQVNRLKRVAEGKLKLGKLPLGQWRYLTEEEVKEITYA